MEFGFSNQSIRAMTFIKLDEDIVCFIIIYGDIRIDSMYTGFRLGHLDHHRRLAGVLAVAHCLLFQFVQLLTKYLIRFLTMSFV
jgi:hypothetical protein